MRVSIQFKNWLFAAAIILSVLVLGTAHSPGQITETPAERLSRQETEKRNKPYQLASRIHLETGGSVGYLVVKVKLPKDKYLYSLTQPGAIPPTRLSLESATGFKLTGKFSPDKPAKVIPKDPVFGHAIEKHLGSVQFFAPIKLEPGAVATQLKATVKIEGQICGDNTCIPVKEKIASRFASFFQRNAKRGQTRKR